MGRWPGGLSIKALVLKMCFFSQWCENIQWLFFVLHVAPRREVLFALILVLQLDISLGILTYPILRVHKKNHTDIRMDLWSFFMNKKGECYDEINGKKYTSIFVLILRLSKCVVSYQYDTTWHMCQKNNTTQHNTDNTHKKYFFLRVIELEVFIQTYDNWFSSKIIYKLCGSIFRAFMTSPLIWINLLV